MLKNTFIHLPGFGRKKERALWSAGVLTWDDFENSYSAQHKLFPSDDPNSVLAVIQASKEALSLGDAEFFATRLPRNEHYRIAVSMPKNTGFLDIETTGLSLYYDQITVIGLSIDKQYRCFINYTNRKSLRSLLSGVKCLVTFNGTAFDLKFLAKEFPELKLPKAHVDLRFFARAVGLRGGQKAIEEELNIRRPKNVGGVMGEQAPLLWHEYRLGDIEAAKRLIQYNHADVEGMRFILDSVMDRISKMNGDAIPFQFPPSFQAAKSSLKWAPSKSTVKPGHVYVPKFRLRSGPQVTYRDLAFSPDLRSLRIVGIDLTGSATRPTGWCFLNGHQAHTKRLGDDSELLVETLNVMPDLVSIDSPLSLPKGRVRVTDDDPGRKEFGIVRECERTLMKRGVSVYPCLINSMQALTGRGMRLAGYFRSLGLPVIESYPGAAQDIMSIPRKRAGLEYLKKGIKDFGIAGSFLESNVSHDEVDAVTAAVVGLFFWSGMFEALGNEEEDYLIIPDLHTSPEEWRCRKVVGWSGPIAAGKTTAAKFLEGKGFAYGRFSLVIAEIARERGLEANRETLQEIGSEVHESPGQRWLCKRLIHRLPTGKDLAIDGLRFPEDHATLVEAFGPAFVHAHVIATEDVRKQRYREMGNRVSEFLTASNHAVETKVPLMSRLADVAVGNQAGRDAFTRWISRAILSKKTHRGGAACR